MFNKHIVRLVTGLTCIVKHLDANHCKCMLFIIVNVEERIYYAFYNFEC